LSTRYGPVRADAAQALPLVHPGRWAFEPKWDGFRCIAFRGPERAVLQSRQQRPLPRYFPEIAGAVSELDREVVVDGELVVWHEGRLDFAALQQRIHPADARARQLSIVRPASYIVFDLLARDGVDLRPLPYRKRRKKLEKLLSHRLPHGLVLMPMSTDRAVAQAWCQPRRGRHRGRRGQEARSVLPRQRPHLAEDSNEANG